MTRITRSVLLLFVAIFSGNLRAADGDDLFRLVTTQVQRYPNTPLRVEGDKVIYSQYAADGNNQDIIAIDANDGHAETITHAGPEGRFIAADDKYIVYNNVGGVARPLIVVDRATGDRKQSIRLRDFVVWGEIRNERLTIVQQNAVLIFRLPELKLERTIPIERAMEIQPWNDKFVAIGNSLSIYDQDFNRISSAVIPPSNPDLHVGCDANNLRIHKDLAILNAHCQQIALYDLPKGTLIRAQPGFSLFHSFDVIEDLLFVGTGDDIAENMRVYELRTGRELARLPIEASFMMASAGHLLTHRTREFSKPANFVVYEPNIQAIKNESSRVARVLAHCPRLAQFDTPAIYEAVAKCEAAGILGYVDFKPLTQELSTALLNYAEYLVHTISRYQEVGTVLANVGKNPRGDALLAFSERKSVFFKPTTKRRFGPIPPGVDKLTIDFGAFSDLIVPSGERAYVARWSCGANGTMGVTFDVLNRSTLTLIKRVPILKCDDNFQDAISAIHEIPGFIVLGIEHRYEEVRTNVVVLDVKSLEVVSRTIIAADPMSLVAWQGALVRCSTSPTEPHTQFDPVSATLVAATEKQSIACLNGEVKKPTDEFTVDRTLPIVTTDNYYGYAIGYGTPQQYRFISSVAGNTEAKTYSKSFALLFAIPGRDAVIVQAGQRQEMQFARFDIAAENETILFNFDRQNSVVAATVWHQFLFVSVSRDLLVYDLDHGLVVRYEKDLIEEGLEPICGGCNDRNGIRKLQIDKDRLMALTLDGANSRVIDLPVYTKELQAKDFFLALMEGK